MKVFSGFDYRKGSLADVFKTVGAKQQDTFFSPVEELALCCLAKKGLNLTPLLNQAVPETQYILCTKDGGPAGAVWDEEAGQLVVDTPKGERTFKVGFRKH